MTFLTGYEITRSIESNYSIPACLIGLLRRAVVTILSIVRIPGKSEIGPIKHNPHYRGIDLSQQLLRTRKGLPRGMAHLTARITESAETDRRTASETKLIFGGTRAESKIELTSAP